MKHNGARFRLLIFTLILIVVAIISLFMSKQCNHKNAGGMAIQSQPKVITTVYSQIRKHQAVKTTHVHKEEEVGTWTDEEVYLLAKIAMAEAEGEDVIGKALVICVILNRVQSTEFPSTIYDVIYDPGQFTPIYDGRFNLVEPNDDCYKALEIVKRGQVNSNDALYFESSGQANTWHSRNLDFVFKHGGHKFYK